MKLQAALTYIYSSHINKEELENPFVLFSTLSDICNDTFKNKEEVKLYWRIISKVNIYKILLDNGITNGVKCLKEKYSYYSECFSFFEYKKMIQYTIESMNYTDNIDKKRKCKINGFDIRNGILYKYSGRKSMVIIPENVRVIKYNAIDGLKSIKKIVIPSTVEKIESFAINNLPNLEKIEVHNVNSIQDYSFWNCNGIVQIQQ